jgi:hypothetical protein
MKKSFKLRFFVSMSQIFDFFAESFHNIGNLLWNIGHFFSVKEHFFKIKYFELANEEVIKKRRLEEHPNFPIINPYNCPRLDEEQHDLAIK